MANSKEECSKLPPYLAGSFPHYTIEQPFNCIHGGRRQRVGQIFLAESAIFYPYTLHGVFGKAVSWSVLILFADTVATQSLGEVLAIK